MKYSYTLKEGRKGSKEGIGGMDKGKESVRGGTKGKGIDRRLTIDKEKECSGLISNCPSNQSLPCPWWTIQENTTRWLHSNSLEQLRVT